MEFNPNIIFHVAGIGIITAFLHTIFKQMGKEDFAHWVTLIAFIYILFLVITKLQDLFTKIKGVFLFQ